MGDGGVRAVEALRNFMNAGDAVFLRRSREFSADAGMALCVSYGVRSCITTLLGFRWTMLDCKS